MRVTRGADLSSEPLEPDHFSGPARRRDYGRIEQWPLNPLLVSFEDGARTNWHTHAGGQLLYVLEGRGRVGSRDGDTAVLEPGDLVYSPPGEEHWHGAAEGSSMSHVALSFGDTDWLEPV